MKNLFVHYGFNQSYGIAKDLAKSTSTLASNQAQHLATLVFIAFTYESAINHLGKLTYKHWEQHYEKLSPEAKLFLLLDKSDIEADFSKRPFQSFGLVFKVRNALAHPKVSEFEATEDELNDVSRWPQPKWKEQARNLKPIDAIADLDAVIQLLEGALHVMLPPRFLLAEHVEK